MDIDGVFYHWMIYIFYHLMISRIISHCPILQLSQNYNSYKNKHHPSKWCNQLAPLIMIVLPTFNEQTSQCTWQDLAITTYIHKFLNDNAKWECNTKRHVHEPKCNDQSSQHKWTLFWSHMSCIKLQPLEFGLYYTKNVCAPHLFISIQIFLKPFSFLTSHIILAFRICQMQIAIAKHSEENFYGGSLQELELLWFFHLT
jgi:hypothetical protein